MNKLILILALLFSGCVFQQRIDHDFSLRYTLKESDRSHESVLQVIARDDDIISFGSSFVINYKKNTFVITALHVVDSMSDIRFFNHEGNMCDFLILDTIQTNFDIVIYRISSYDRCLTISDKVVPLEKKDMKLYVYGYPGGQDIQKMVGDYYQNRNMEYILSPVRAGMSGGPVLDERGYVIGVLTNQIVETNSNISYGGYVNIGYILNALDESINQVETNKQDVIKF